MRISIDIDQTLLYTDNEYNILEVNKKLIDSCNKLYYEGNEIIIETGRHWDKLEMTIKQLIKHNIKYTTLVMGRTPCNFYVNDKSIKPGEFCVIFK